jgi:hypothetical protein
MWILDGSILPLLTEILYSVAAAVAAIFGMQPMMPILSVIILLSILLEWNQSANYYYDLVLYTKKRE